MNNGNHFEILLGFSVVILSLALYLGIIQHSDNPSVTTPHVGDTVIIQSDVQAEMIFATSDPSEATTEQAARRDPLLKPIVEKALMTTYSAELGGFDFDNDNNAEIAYLIDEIQETLSLDMNYFFSGSTFSPKGKILFEQLTKALNLLETNKGLRIMITLNKNLLPGSTKTTIASETKTAPQPFELLGPVVEMVKINFDESGDNDIDYQLRFTSAKSDDIVFTDLELGFYDN